MPPLPLNDLRRGASTCKRIRQLSLRVEPASVADGKESCRISCAQHKLEMTTLLGRFAFRLKLLFA